MLILTTVSNKNKAMERSLSHLLVFQIKEHLAISFILFGEQGYSVGYWKKKQDIKPDLLCLQDILEQWQHRICGNGKCLLYFEAYSD